VKPSENFKLLTVEETFLIEGRGVVALPPISDFNGLMSFSVVLQKPSGEAITVQAELDSIRLNPPRPDHPFAICFKGLSKQDVPIGTEIWIQSPKQV
jgi:hypothetical protein